MKRRALSTVILWALVIATVAGGGGLGALALLAAFGTLAQFELGGLLARCGLAPWRVLSLSLGAAIILGAGLCPDGNTLWLAAAVAVVLGALPMATQPAAAARLAGTVLSLACVPAFLQYYALILRDFAAAAPRGDGVWLPVWVVLVAKFTDMGGYLAGSTIGGPKLAPRISPNKTWSGALGGILLAVGAGALAAHLASGYFPPWLTTRQAAWLAVPLSVASILSDLAESALKRRAGAKDSGRRIPGIGGALDLADSLLLPAPVAYYLFVCVAGLKG